MEGEDPLLQPEGEVAASEGGGGEPSLGDDADAKTEGEVTASAEDGEGGDAAAATATATAAAAAAPDAPPAEEEEAHAAPVGDREEQQGGEAEAGGQEEEAAEGNSVAPAAAGETPPAAKPSDPGKVPGVEPSAKEREERRARDSKEGDSAPAEVDYGLPEIVAAEHVSETRMDKEMRGIIAGLGKDKDWVVRATALRRLQGLVLGGCVGVSSNFLKAIKGSDFASLVGLLFTDLRSNLVKEAGDAFSLVAQYVGGAQSDKLVRDYDGFLSDVVMPEALKSTAKANGIIAGAGDACVRALVNHVHSARLLRPIVEPLMDSRSNSKMRGSCSDYLVLVLQTWPAERIEKTSFHQDSTKARVEFTDAIEVSIRSCLSDGKADTRGNAKTMYELYEGLFPAHIEAFRSSLNKQQLRNLEAAAPPPIRRVLSGEKAKLHAINNPPAALDTSANDLRPGMEGYDEKTSLRARIVELQDRLEKSVEQLAHERRRSKGLHKMRDDAERRLKEEQTSRQRAAEEAATRQPAEGVAEELGRKLEQAVARAKKVSDENKRLKVERDRLQAAAGARLQDDDEPGHRAPNGPPAAAEKAQNKPTPPPPGGSRSAVGDTSPRNAMVLGEGHVGEGEEGGEGGRQLREKLTRAKLDLEYARKEIAHVRGRWNAREEEWFKTRMELEASIEALRAAVVEKTRDVDRLREDMSLILKASSEGTPRSEAILSENSAQSHRREEPPSRSDRYADAHQRVDTVADGLRVELGRQEGAAMEARSTAAAAQQELAHWRVRVGEVESERARLREQVERMRADHEWRGGGQQQEIMRLRAMIEQSETARVRAEGNLREIVSAMQNDSTGAALHGNPGHVVWAEQNRSSYARERLPQIRADHATPRGSSGGKGGPHPPARRSEEGGAPGSGKDKFQRGRYS